MRLLDLGLGACLGVENGREERGFKGKVFQEFHPQSRQEECRSKPFHCRINQSLGERTVLKTLRYLTSSLGH